MEGRRGEPGTARPSVVPAPCRPAPLG